MYNTFKMVLLFSAALFLAPKSYCLTVSGAKPAVTVEDTPSGNDDPIGTVSLLNFPKIAITINIHKPFTKKYVHPIITSSLSPSNISSLYIM